MTEVEAAVRIIERLEEIASNDMLIQGTYLEVCPSGKDPFAPYRPDLRDAPCGGHRACMVGSFFLASDVNVSEIGTYVSLRNVIAEKIPGMKMAREALNCASYEHPDYPHISDEIDYDSDVFDPMEELFENGIIHEYELGPLVHKICEKALEKLSNT